MPELSAATRSSQTWTHIGTCVCRFVLFWIKAPRKRGAWGETPCGRPPAVLGGPPHSSIDAFALPVDVVAGLFVYDRQRSYQLGWRWRVHAGDVGPRCDEAELNQSACLPVGEIVKLR
jgi:hypothetical protein